MKFGKRNFGTKHSQRYTLVVLRGDSVVETLVRVDTLDGSIHFMDGWSDFVASERIVTGDIGHFVLVEPHRLLMKLYGPDGELRPLASRPLVWNLFLAYGNQVDAHQPVGGHGRAPEIVGSPENAAQDHVDES